MVSILDIADDELPFKITIRKSEVDAYPLSLSDIFYLFRRFPVLLAALANAKLLSGEIIGQLIGDSPTILAEIIAASQRKDEKSLLGNAETIKKALRLPATQQMAAATVILEASFPEGFGPFDREMGNLLGLFIVKKPEEQPTPSEKSSQLSWTADLVGTPRPPRKRRPPGSSTPSTSSPSKSTTEELPTTPMPVATPTSPSISNTATL
jgi:hypothetical protein